jgi:hypothetical protein
LEENPIESEREDHFIGSIECRLSNPAS